MKMKNPLKFTPYILGCAAFMFCVVAPVSTLDAEPVSVTQTVSATISVNVPEGSEAVTYMLNGELVTIAPGTTGVVIPAGATNITLPTNVVLTVSHSGAAQTSSYTVSPAVVLPNMQPIAFTESSSSFRLLSGPIQPRSSTFRALEQAIRLISNNYQASLIVARGSVTDGN